MSAPRARARAARETVSHMPHFTVLMCAWRVCVIQDRDVKFRVDTHELVKNAGTRLSLQAFTEGRATSAGGGGAGGGAG